jgi:general secretion pathway protein D
MERIPPKIMTSVSEKQKDSTPVWSTRLSFVFGLCALLGVLLLIFSEIGFAKPVQGIQLAQRGFPAGSGPAIGNPVNDPYDDEDFEDFNDDGGGDNMAQPAGGGRFGGVATRRNNQTPPPSYNPNGASNGISVGGTADDKPGAELKKTRKGYALAGPGSEKAIKSKNELPALTVDTESGDGVPANKELITDFNFPDANIMDIAKTLGRLTGKNFILDKEVKGNVTIISNAPITVSDAWRAFLTSLDMNSLAIVPTGNFLRIMRQNDAKGKNVRLYSNTRAPNTDALVTKIFKIKYISAKELENVIRTYANMGARIYGFEQTNTLIITDTGSNIDKIAKMIAFLDVEGFDAGIEVIQVKYASAVELQKLIDSLLPGTQANLPGRGGFAGGGGGFGGGSRAGGTFQARRTKQGGFVNTIIPDERTNTLIVHANPKGAEEVRELVTRLDRKIPSAANGGKVHVVYLQFAEAEEMAKTLNNFSQTTKPASGGFGLPGSMGGLGINPNEGNLFEGQIKLSADKTTNSLVITASPTDYETLQHVINKLDIPRDQIFVEILIMEISMSRDSQYAANVVQPSSGVSVSPTTDLIQLLQNPAALPTGMVLQYQSSGTKTVNIPANGTTAATSVTLPNFAALIKALQTSSNANVLATPQLMTLDNVEATFESSDHIPQAGAVAGIGGTVTSAPTYIDVPLTIKIKPQLNKISNFIKMDIKANISDVNNRNVPSAVAGIATQTLKRSAETSVMVADADTVVIGGLVRDKSDETISKVPLLGDIPILGWLFKSRTASTTKSNLMIFITPKIMRQPEAVRAVLDAKLKARDEFVEKEFGGEDPVREVRNDMIRSLPDVKTIKAYNAKRNFSLDDEGMISNTSKPQASNDMPKTAPGRDTKDTLTLPELDPVEKKTDSPATAPAPSGSDAVPPSITAPESAAPGADPFSAPSAGNP